MTERSEGHNIFHTVINRFRRTDVTAETEVAKEVNNPSIEEPPLFPENPGLSNLSLKLAEANLGTPEMRRTLLENYRRSYSEYWEFMRDMSVDSFKLLAEATNDKPSQKYIFTIFAYRDSDETLPMAKELNKYTEEAVDRPELKQILTDFLDNGLNIGIEDKEFAENEGLKFTRRLVAACRTFTNDTAFSVFGNDVNNFSTYISSNEHRFSPKSYNIQLETLKAAPLAKEYVNGVDPEQIFRRDPAILQEVVRNSESVALVKSYLSTGRTWADRIRYFKQVLKLKNLEYSEGIENDQELLERISKDENERNPWVSMNLATTTGWEIEYPDNTPYIKKVIETKAIKLLSAIGFKEGGGMTNTDEASPGPFYSFETNSAVYKLYHDAKIIYPENDLGMTMHFNIGRLPKTDIKTLTPFIRSLYLTGAGYDPHYEAYFPSLYILPNHNEDTRETYIESKVFDVTTNSDTIWNLEAASVLSVAFKASLDVKSPDVKANIYRTELASIWSEYLHNIQIGLDYFGQGDYLYEFRNKDISEEPIECVKWVDSQLAKIWKDPEYYEVPILERTGQTVKEMADPNGVQGLQVGDKWYPNIAYFAREMAEETASKVLLVKEKVEHNCIKDIKRIDGLTGYRRRRSLKRFTEFYGLKVDGDENDFEAMERAFADVKNLMVSETGKEEA